MTGDVRAVNEFILGELILAGEFNEDVFEAGLVAEEGSEVPGVGCGEGVDGVTSV